MMKRVRKPKPTITEAQAWKIVATMFGLRTGICNVIRQMFDNRIIDGSTVCAMRARLEAERVRIGVRDGLGFYWSCTPGVIGDFVLPDMARRDFATRAAREAARARPKR